MVSDSQSNASKFKTIEDKFRGITIELASMLTPPDSVYASMTRL